MITNIFVNKNATHGVDQQKNRKRKIKSHVVILYSVSLGIYSIATYYHHHLSKMVEIPKQVNEIEEGFTLRRAGNKFRLSFFTTWNFVLQIAFLLIAVTDELTKFLNLTSTQKKIERTRKCFFSTLVFPSTLLVASVFWTIWHVDRELIFPKVIDTFYPSWLNHTLHTFILLPLLIETVIHFKSAYSNLSRTRAILILLIYVTVYQTLYLSVYLQHGVWLYPIYKVLTWTQRIMFTLMQLLLAVSYQQIGISLMKRNTALPKSKIR